MLHDLLTAIDVDWLCISLVSLVAGRHLLPHRLDNPVSVLLLDHLHFDHADLRLDCAAGSTGISPCWIDAVHLAALFIAGWLDLRFTTGFFSMAVGYLSFAWAGHLVHGIAPCFPGLECGFGGGPAHVLPEPLRLPELRLSGDCKPLRAPSVHCKRFGYGCLRSCCDLPGAGLHA